MRGIVPSATTQEGCSIGWGQSSTGQHFAESLTIFDMSKDNDHGDGPRPASSERGLSDETHLLHDDRYSEGAVSPPIYQTSLFTFESYAALLKRCRGESDHAIYSRAGNPTVDILSNKMAELEGGEAATALASGMTAISSAILSIVQSGDRILSINHIYPDAYRFMRGFCAGLGIVTEFVDGTDIEAVCARLPGAKLLYLESPGTWLMQEQDIAALAKAAREHGVITILDNSWATPIFQKPLSVGIDMVVHSASKYLSGHSDVVAGIVVGSNELIHNMNHNVCTFLGGILSAHESALVIRGLRTLPLRMRRHQDSALSLASRLADRLDVERVYHPGLEKPAFSQLSGYGGLFSIEVSDCVDIETFCNSLSLFRMGVSWGGYESLVMPAAATMQQDVPYCSAVDFGVPPRLIRLFVGLEDLDDLWRDLDNAFRQSY